MYIVAVLSQLTWLIDLLHCSEFISVLFVKRQQNTNALLPEVTLAQF